MIKIEALLKKFDYKYQRKNNELTIKLDFSQRVIINYADSEKVKIKDRLVGWNFLTGILVMSIKNAALYNFTGAMLMTCLVAFLDREQVATNLIFICIALMIWILLWTIFYLVKAESFKRTLMSWNE